MGLEGGGSKHLQNVGNTAYFYMVLSPRNRIHAGSDQTVQVCILR